jgi:CheY-like chemotaxis protein
MEGSQPVFTDEELEQQEAEPYAGYVLVIDDSLTFRSLISQKLELSNCHYVLAASGEEGLKTLQVNMRENPNDPFDMILVDYYMPGGMNGVQVVEEIRRMGYRSKVVGVSGEGDQARDAFLSSSVDEFLPKPINGMNLIALLNDMTIFSMRQSDAMQNSMPRRMSAINLNLEDAIKVMDAPDSSSMSGLSSKNSRSPFSRQLSSQDSDCNMSTKSTPSACLEEVDYLGSFMLSPVAAEPFVPSQVIT